MEEPIFYEKTFNNGKGGHFALSWSDKAAEFLRKNQYKYIELSGYFGDLLFLSEFSSFLETVIVRNYDFLVSGLHSLKNLKSLILHYRAKDRLDFKNFPNLEVCQFFHNKDDIKYLYALPNIKSTVVPSFGEKNLLSFGHRTNIDRLYLSRPRIETLEGIAAAENLKSFRLADARYLEDITEIANLPNLENMLVQTAKKIKDCTPFGQVTSLKSLVLICTGGLEETDWVSSLVNLEKLAFTGFPVEVNWNKVMALPNLREVFILQSKEHAPTDEEIKEKALKAGKVIAKIERTGTKKIPLISVRFSPPIDP